MKKITFLLIFFVVYVNATDYRYSYIANEYTGTKLGKTVVYYPDIALSMESFFEKGFTELLNEHEHIKATSFLDVVTPFDRLTDTQAIKKLTAQGYEQLLLITRPKFNRENIITMGQLFNQHYMLADVVMKVEIFDLKKNKEPMWIGDVSVLHDLTTYELRNYMRKQIVFLLKKDGLIQE